MALASSEACGMVIAGHRRWPFAVAVSGVLCEAQVSSTREMSRTMLGLAERKEE